MNNIIAVYDRSNQFKKFIQDTDVYEYVTDLSALDYQKYQVIMINGYDTSPLILSSEVLTKLWKFVDGGGLLYGEMLNCEDFKTSRLFGFKQDFSLSQRRLEKLRIAKENDFCHKGQILEWNGGFLTGFTFDTEILVELDIFPETHLSQESGKYPGIVAKRLGKGRSIYSTFSLFGNEKSSSLRPNWLWGHLISWLKKDYSLPCTMIESSIQMSSKDTKQVINESANWFLNSGIMPKSDGSLGVYENVHSIRGNISKDIRPDCNAHTALMFYLLGELYKEQEWKIRSENILNYLFESGFQDLDPTSNTFGFWKWYDFPGKKPDQIFSDDNGWVAFVLLYLYRKTGIEEYKTRGLATAYSLLKTQNILGLRPECIREKELTSKGFKYFQYSSKCSLNPHFECIVHAALLQAFIVTKDNDFLLSVRKGTIHLLESLDELQFMYSKTAGYSRFLFSLSHLYSLTKDSIYHEGINSVMKYLIQHQHVLGGVEEADNPDPERYGAEDTGVFRENGEKISDQLYTNNFLVINVWEAWNATKDEDVLDFHKKIVRFISDIQIITDDKLIRGGWMRSFHLESKEYFGNNGDTGWGAYCMESGWTNALITSGLLLQELDWSFVDY